MRRANKGKRQGNKLPAKHPDHWARSHVRGSPICKAGTGVQMLGLLWFPSNQGVASKNTHTQTGLVACPANPMFDGRIFWIAQVQLRLGDADALGLALQREQAQKPGMRKADETSCRCKVDGQLQLTAGLTGEEPTRRKEQRQAIERPCVLIRWFLLLRAKKAIPGIEIHLRGPIPLAQAARLEARGRGKIQGHPPPPAPLRAPKLTMNHW